MAMDRAAVDLTNTSDEDEAPRAAKRARTTTASTCCIDLVNTSESDDDSTAAARAAAIPPAVRAVPAARAAPAVDAAPSWLRLNGARRICAELKSIQNVLSKPGSLGALRRVWLPNEDKVNTWRMEVRGFDGDIPGGAALNHDLSALAEQTQGQHSSVIMECQFPPTFPQEPFFLRVVLPRMVMYTGHITAGGSVCVEALSTSGTPGAWQRTFTFEGIMTTVLHNMIDVEAQAVRTATGPGGRSGPLRVDLARGTRWCTQEYSRAEVRTFNAQFI